MDKIAAKVYACLACGSPAVETVSYHQDKEEYGEQHLPFTLISGHHDHDLQRKLSACVEALKSVRTLATVRCGCVAGERGKCSNCRIGEISSNALAEAER